MIDDKNFNAKNITDFLFEKNIKLQISNARNSFNSHAGDYMTTIQEQKIKLSSSSTEEIELRLVDLKKLNEDISLIIAELE